MTQEDDSGDFDLLQAFSCEPDDDDDEAKAKAANTARRNARLNQTEEEFQMHKASWLPHDDILEAQDRRKWVPPTADVVPSKERALAWKWCAEERFFLKDYDNSYKFGQAALRCKDLTETDTDELKYLLERLAIKLGSTKDASLQSKDASTAAT